jgi:hypothetical protein
MRSSVSCVSSAFFEQVDERRAPGKNSCYGSDAVARICRRRYERLFGNVPLLSHMTGQYWAKLGKLVEQAALQLVD